MLKQVERHFGKRLIVTSGYRSPAYNKKVRGAEKSQHMYCAAVDVQLPGVSKWELAKFVRAMPGRGGVGTYCHALDPYRRRTRARLELEVRPPQGLSVAAPPALPVDGSWANPVVVQTIPANKNARGKKDWECVRFTGCRLLTTQL